MKNSTKLVCRALALALIVLLAFGAAACNKSNKSTQKTDAELVVGTWQVDINIAPALEKSMKENDKIDDPEKLKFSDAFFKINLELKEDGTYKVASDKDSVTEAMASISKELAPIVKDTFMAQMSGIDEAEILGMFGVESWEALAKVMMDVDAKNMAFDGSGKYTLEDGKISFESSDENEGEKNEAADYTVSDDELKLSPEDGKSIEGIPAEFFPIVFKRVK
ncbi:MAG: hypothetical protein IKS90_04405 [Clostridia bacterium]|nr:hypothetical protein [Clostridia bacterium]